MTQALNLANFANNLNTSGATTNAGLQNSSVTVTAGTAMSGGGAVSLGGSVTLNNAGVTSVVAGTGISVSGATGAVTISSSGASGTVTSIATNNGLTGGTITTSGTIGIDVYNGTNFQYTSYAIGTSVLITNAPINANTQVNNGLTIYTPSNSCTYAKAHLGISSAGGGSSAMSGTWRARGVADGVCGLNSMLVTRTA
jgi:hypothetical protein